MHALKQFPGTKGRGLISTSFLRPGEVFLKENPVASVLNPSKTSQYCHHCYRIHSSSTTPYCSSQCTTNAQSLLDKCDATLLNNSTLSPSPSPRRFPFLIAQLVASSITDKTTTFHSFWKQTLTLAAPDNFNGGEETAHDYDNLQKCFHSVMGTDASQAIFGSALDLDWYNRMHGILHVNSIGLNPLPSLTETLSNPDPSTYPIVNDVGVGLFLTASMLNHSCDPNLVMYRDPLEHDSSVMFVAARDIQVNEECTISYLSNSLTSNVHARKEELLYKYGFACNCALCQSQEKEQQ